MTINSAITVLLAAFFAQADPGTVIHPEPGSKADSIVFHAFVIPDSVHANRNLASITVRKCYDAPSHAARIVWRVVRRDEGAQPPLFLPYGRLPGPNWWTQVRPAEPLPPGCYFVYSSGGGIALWSEFEVRQDATVRPKPR